jgi:hypothetical protein
VKKNVVVLVKARVVDSVIVNPVVNETLLQMPAESPRIHQPRLITSSFWNLAAKKERFPSAPPWGL